MENVKRLVLIDGHAILHRAYHALPPMTNKDGVQTNAVYGFTTMLLRIISDLKPDFLAVAFDLPQPTFRMQQYTAYQAKRPEMVSNLSEQIPLVHEMLEALKIPYFEVAGFEADDVIGTLATQAVDGTVDGGKWKIVSEDRKSKIDKKNLSSNFNHQLPSSTFDHPSSCDVIIVTGDRDMLQLINDRVRVCVPVKGLAETKIYNEDLVKSEFGVHPKQWVDVKALKGDASDNYPGVAGVGPKTAEKLIAKYETLENLYKNLLDLDPKLRLKLAEGIESAGMSQKLARIVCDVPLQFDLEKTSVEKINWQEGVKYMRGRVGFRSIPEKIEKGLHGLVTDHTDNVTKEKTSEQLGLI